MYGAYYLVFIVILYTNPPTRVPSTTLQQTSSPDITSVSNTPYNRTSWTTQHALSSGHLLSIITINMRHDHRLQQNRHTFTNYKNAYWIRFTEDTEFAFTQTTTYTLPIKSSQKSFCRQTSTIYQKVRCTATAGSYPTT